MPRIVGKCVRILTYRSLSISFTFFIEALSSTLSIICLMYKDCMRAIGGFAGPCTRVPKSSRNFVEYMDATLSSSLSSRCFKYMYIKRVKGG